MAAGLLGAVSSQVSASSAAEAELTPALDIAPWTRRQGEPVLWHPYGQPSSHERDVVRRSVTLRAATPGAASSLTPLHKLYGTVTPNGLVFERHHAGIPLIDPDAHRLALHGMVKSPMVFTMDDLMRFPAVSRIHFLECSGNTGREWNGPKVLFVNPGTTSHIVGLKERESQALLDLLYEEVSRPEYTVRFRWTPNAIVMWDNQATAHAVPIDYAHFDLPRVVRRINVAGELPVGPGGFRSQPLDGELFDIIG